MTLSETSPPEAFAALDAVRHGVLVICTRTFERPIVHANPAFAKLTGHDATTTLGSNLLFLTGVDSDPVQVQTLREAVLKAAAFSGDIVLHARDGRALPTHVVIAPLTDAQGARSHLLVTIEDTSRVARVNESLRTSEARLQVAMDAGKLPMWDWNVERDEISYNEHWRTALGVEPQQLLKREQLSERLGLPTDRPEVLEQFERHFHGDTPYFESEYLMTTATGEVKWFRARAHVVQRDAKGRPLRVIGLLRDISRLMRELQASRAVQERWERAVHGTSDGLYDWDLLTGHVWYAEHFRDIIGYAETDFPDTFNAFQNVLHADDRALILNKIRRHLENQVPLDVRCRVMRRDGTSLWCRMRGQAVRDAAGRPLRLSGSISDISAQIEAEEALGRSQNFYGTILDSLPLYIAFVDRDEKIVYANRPFQEFFGLPLVTTRGHAVSDALGERYHAFGPKFRAALAGNTVEAQEQLFGSNDQPLDIEAVFLPHLDDAGAVLGCFVAARDVTERKQLEAELRQSQKMEAIGRLTGGIAHDFNNLLAVIVGNMQLLARALRESPRLRHQAETAMKAAMRGADLTRRLLAFARQQVLEPRVVDLPVLIGGMYELLRRSLTGDIEIRQVSESTVWPVRIDPGQLENAVLNLVINARDAMPGGGVIMIGTRNETVTETAASENQPQPGEYTLLEVMDTGSGMSPETLKRAFEPFFTTKDVGKGSGLGLAMVYGFVRQSGGHVRIDSAVGKGTTVQLFLPRAPGELEKVPRESVTTAELSRGSETILVVEDNAEVRATAVDILSSLGYRALAASNGYQALERFMQYADIALVFSDVMLPGGLSGSQLVEKLRERRPGLKVLMTSAFSESSILSREILDGTLQLLTKPYRVEDLARQVRSILDEN